MSNIVMIRKVQNPAQGVEIRVQAGIWGQLW